MINITEFFSCIFYIMLVVLVIVLIIFVFNAMKTLGKIDNLVDDLSVKSSKLDGVFSIVDGATDAVIGFSDNIVNYISNGFNKIMNRKKEKKDE